MINCKTFMKNVVKISDELAKLNKFSEKYEEDRVPEGVIICRISDDYIHIYEGIEILAEELGAELKEIYENDKLYKLHFKYADKDVFQIVKEENEE